jgi:hypothetical protein
MYTTVPLSRDSIRPRGSRYPDPTQGADYVPAAEGVEERGGGAMSPMGASYELGDACTAPDGRPGYWNGARCVPLGEPGGTPPEPLKEPPDVGPAEAVAEAAE